MKDAAHKYSVDKDPLGKDPVHKDPAPHRIKEHPPQLVVERHRRDVRGKRGTALAGRRAWALRDFLRKMKEHNADVVSALSGKKADGEQA